MYQIFYWSYAPWFYPIHTFPAPAFSQDTGRLSEEREQQEGQVWGVEVCDGDWRRQTRQFLTWDIPQQLRLINNKLTILQGNQNKIYIDIK